MTAGCAAVLAGAFVLPRLVPAPDLQENRALAGPPPPIRSLGELDSFRAATDAYVADRLPPRTWLISALNRARMWVGVSGSPRVIVGRDGWLFSDDGSHLGAARNAAPLPPQAVAEWLSGLAGRREALAAQGVAYVVLAAPLKETVYPEKAPGWFELDASRAAVTLSRLAQASEAGAVVYPHEPLRRQARWGLKVYSRHDTHWTGLGAYLGYAGLMRELQRQGVGDGPRPLEAFRETRAREPAKPRDLALMLGVASFVDVDYPELADPAAPRLEVTYLGPRTDWTAPRVIDTGLADKPVLVMTMDSFSAALLPFLYGDFSRIVLAHNHDGSWRADLVARYRPDAVVTEVVEGGLPYVMAGSPPASEASRARIREVVVDRRRYGVHAPAAEFAWSIRRRAIAGGEGPDRLNGGNRAEDLHGRQGDDTIQGRGGEDALRGGRGRDRLDGGDGGDWLSGGRDDDVLRGGPGADTFALAADTGSDVVEDFSVEEGDRVDIELGAGKVVRQMGADTVIEVTGGRLILRGVRVADLPADAIRRR